MSKESYYFSHDYNARSDEKIVKLLKDEGWIGYGLYWAIVEKLHEAEGWLEYDCDSIAYDLRTQSELIAKLLQRTDLFKINGTKFTTDRVLLNIAKRLDKSHKARESAQLSWINRDTNHANAMQSHTERNAIKERKGKEINTYTEQVQIVFNHFCNKLKKNISLTPERQRIIEIRLKEKRTVEEMSMAIDNFSKDEWPDRHKYCDIVYVIGTRNKVNNLDRWLNNKTTKKWDI